MALARFSPSRSPFPGTQYYRTLWEYVNILEGRWMMRYWLCNVEPIRSQAGGLQVESEAPRLIPIRQATGKLSLSIQSSSAALMTHPTYVRPLKHPSESKFPSSPTQTLSTSSRLTTYSFRLEVPAGTHNPLPSNH